MRILVPRMSCAENQLVLNSIEDFDVGIFLSRDAGSQYACCGHGETAHTTAYPARPGEAILLLEKAIDALTRMPTSMRLVGARNSSPPRVSQVAQRLYRICRTFPCYGVYAVPTRGLRDETEAAGTLDCREQASPRTGADGCLVESILSGLA